MTKEEIKRFKEHIEIHARREPHAIKITQIMWKIVEELTDKDKQIEELEKKLEQTEKDLADYQFNYPTIKELEKRTTEAKEIIKELLNICKEPYLNKESVKKLDKAKAFLNDTPKYNEDLENCRGWHAKENLIKE